MYTFLRLTEVKVKGFIGSRNVVYKIEKQGQDGNMFPSIPSLVFNWWNFF